MAITRPAVTLLAGLTIGSTTLAAENFQLPTEVTPALRAACETDVRRLCIDDSPTVEKVKSCVRRRYGELSTRCKVAIAAAGLGGSRTVAKEPLKRPTSATSDRSGAVGSKPDNAVAGFYGK